MADSVNLDDLFDADALHRSGECPWTIFAYPTSLADSRGLPPDDDAQMLFAELQKRGIPIAIWVSAIAENTTYFACRFGDRDRVNQIVNELEKIGILEKDYLSKRSDYFFSLGNSGTQQRDAPESRWPAVRRINNNRRDPVIAGVIPLELVHKYACVSNQNGLGNRSRQAIARARCSYRNGRQA